MQTLQQLPNAEKHSAQSLFSCFAQQPWAMWLDSCDSDHIDNQFDVIVWSPELTLTTANGQTEITDINGKKIQENGDPLTILARVQSECFDNLTLTDMNSPFKGGAVGYFAYDLGRYFENIPEKTPLDSDMPDMSVGIYLQALIINKYTKEISLLCPEDRRSDLEQSIRDRLKVPPEKTNFSLLGQWRSNMSESDYRAKFNRVHQYLLSGDCYQINLAQRFSASYRGNEFDAYKALRQENNAPFSAFIRFADSAILSISPERFLSVEEDKVQSKPIKGTRPRSEDTVQDKRYASQLQNADKDRAENLMIVDLLRNDISKVCQPGSVVVPKLFDIESFPAVHHLVSTVEGKLSQEFTATDLLRGAFPGGSITGAPKIRAMEIIDELEPNRRSVYCGSIGYISACGNMDTSIAIRTLVCNKGQIHCWAGGGLVADSDVDSEYQETFDKVNKILPILSKL